MLKFLTLCISGVMLGCIYGLIYKASGLMSFVQGDMLTLGAFLGLPYWLSLLLTMLCAFAFGMLRAMIPASAGYYEYLVQFFKNVPPLSMIPLLILWCGIGETTKTVIIVLASFFPMYLNIVKGFTGCDQKLLEVGTMFGYTERQKFFRIMLPYAMADILVGMRIGLGYSLRAIIGAEMVAASTGLGHMILFAQQMSRTDKVIVGIFAIGIAGYLTDRIFGLLISIFLKGAGENGWN